MTGPAKKIIALISRVLPLRRQVRLIAAVLPASLWHAAADTISRIHGTLAKTMGKNGTLTRALMFDHWLKELTLLGPFAIPWRIADDSALRHDEPGRAILFCWTHVPLVELALSASVQLGYKAAIVCDEGMMAGENKFVAPGLKGRVEAIPARSSSIRRVLTELRSGRSVAWLTDPLLGGPISGQTLRLVPLSGARLVFFWGERDANGTIAFHFVDPPFPDCESAAAIEANLDVLRLERHRILSALGAPDTMRILPAKKMRAVTHHGRKQLLPH